MAIRLQEELQNTGLETTLDKIWDINSLKKKSWTMAKNATLHHSFYLILRSYLIKAHEQ